MVNAAAARLPLLTNQIAREALTTYISRGKPTSSKAIDDQEVSWNKYGRLSTFLLNCVSFEESLDVSTRESLLVDLVVLAHHNLICMLFEHSLSF